MKKSGISAKVGRAILLIFGVLGLLMVGSSFLPFIQTARARRSYVPCEAVIQAHELEQYTRYSKYGSSKLTRSRILYAYQYQGVPRCGSRVDFGSKNLIRSRSDFFPGRKMPCFVDPKAPQNAVLFLSSGHFDYPMCCFGLLSVMICFGMFFFELFARKKQRKNEKTLAKVIGGSQQYPLPESVQIPRNVHNPNRTYSLSPVFQCQKDGCWRLRHSRRVFWSILLLSFGCAGICVFLLLAEERGVFPFLGLAGMLTLISVWGMISGRRSAWTFSPVEKAMWRGRCHLRQVADGEMLLDYIRFDEVAAIQLVSKVCQAARGVKYPAMELNLICKDGRLIPVADFAAVNDVIRIAKVLSGLLQVRIVLID